MAKKNPSSNSKNSKKGESIKGPDCARKSADDRRAERAKEARLRRAREEEVASGDFFLRLNAGRSSFVRDIRKGVVGEYAIPGGAKPSAHFVVSKEITPRGPVAVIRLESVQRGHKLEGRAFNAQTFVPAYYVGKFGRNFRSRNDGVMGSTQELIVHYIAGIVGQQEEVEETTEELFAQAKSSSDDIRQMYAGVVGLYGVQTDDGMVILSCEEIRGKSAIRVVSSDVAGIAPSRAYVYPYLLERPTLEQRVDDEIYADQLALFIFLRNNKPEEVKAATKTIGVTPSKKRTQVRPGVQSTEEKVIACVKKHAITLREAATGRLGYVTVPHTTGEMIILYGMVGVDRVVEVKHLPSSHILRLAGCDVGEKVYVGQVMKGEVDHIDQLNHHLTDKEVKAKNAFIRHLIEALDEVGVRLRKRPVAQLRLVKNAA